MVDHHPDFLPSATQMHRMRERQGWLVIDRMRIERDEAIVETGGEPARTQMDDHLVGTQVDPLDQGEKEDPHAQWRQLSELAGEFGQAVTRLLLCNVIQGPGLKIAVAAAEIQPAGKDRVRAAPTSRSGPFAQRRTAARASLEIVALLVDLLDDLPEPVAMEAAVALARMSR